MRTLELGGRQPKFKRRSLFRRDPHFQSPSWRAGHFEIRERDLDMIAAVARHRFLDTKRICRLFCCTCPLADSTALRGKLAAAGSVKSHRAQCACSCGLGSKKGVHAPDCVALFKNEAHVIGRLRELFHSGYLGRPTAQLQMRVGNGVAAGSAPMVYCVTSKGLGVIGDTRREAIGQGKLSWIYKKDNATRMFIEHTLAIADVGIGLDLGLRTIPHLHRVSETALTAGMSAERRVSTHPWSLQGVYKGQVVSAVCDLAFAIYDRKERRQHNFLVEVDRGSMPIERNNLVQTSIRRKLLAYGKAFKEKTDVQAFGWRGFRVLILTTSQKRVEACVAAAKREFENSPVGRIFYFGTLEAADDLFGAAFVDVDGKPVRLMA